MNQPAVEVADLLRAQGSRFLGQYQSSFGYQKLKVFALSKIAVPPHWVAIWIRVLNAAVKPSLITRAATGIAPSAKHTLASTGSKPGNKKCYPSNIFMWSSACRTNSTYLRGESELFYELLFSSSAAATLELAADPKHLGADIGFISILHTWGQNLLLHPHIHCVIPAGGLAPGRTAWITPRSRFFLPVKALARVFRGKFLDGLERLYGQKKICQTGPSTALGKADQFDRLLWRLRRKKWVVYAKAAFGGPAQVLRYLSRYTHRVAISNHRLLAFDGERVTFRWRDYARGGKQREMALAATEFLRRFFLHVLPKGFVRIRHFGFLANRFRTAQLQLCRQLLSCSPPTAVIRAANGVVESTWLCPHCGAPMVIMRRIAAQEFTSSYTFLDSS